LPNVDLTYLPEFGSAARNPEEKTVHTVFSQNGVSRMARRVNSNPRYWQQGNLAAFVLFLEVPIGRSLIGLGIEWRRGGTREGAVV
jgi:hypothetical protein